MTRTAARSARPFLGLGLVLVAVAAIVGWALWLRPATTPKDPSAPGPSGASAARGPRLRPARAQKPASIEGRVTETEGAPIAGATVCATAGAGLVPFDQKEPTCATTAQDGLYHIKDLSPARFTLFASAPGHRPMGYASPDPTHARFLDLRDGEARAGVDFKLPRGGVEVRGHVKDVGGGGIGGARVTLHGWMGPAHGAAVTQTDAQGAFSAWLEEGHFIARAAADGYADSFKDGIAPGPPVEILLTPGSVLVGRVVAAETGAPVSGAKIEPGGEMGFGPMLPRDVQSDDDGRFRVSGLGPGRYKPSARIAGGFGLARESVLLGVGETSPEIVIEMHPAHDVAGRVEVAPGGGPCPNGFVALMNPTSLSAGGVVHAAIDPDGAARFEGVLPGSYEVMVSCPEHVVEPTFPRVEVKDADIEGLVWTVRGGLSIRGRVVDSGNKPVRAAVHAMPETPGPGRPGAFTQSGEDGAFVLRGLLAGKHRVMANARDHVAPAPVEVEVLDDRAPEVTLVMAEGGAIEGSVVDEDRRPIAGAEVMVMGQQPGGFGPPVKSLADGSFEQKGIGPGEYRVWVMKGGMSLRSPGQTEEGPPGVPVTVKAGATARVELVVERQGGEIAGRVLDEVGKPVTDAFIEAIREPDAAGDPGGGIVGRPPMAGMGGWSDSAVLTDPEGEFVVKNLSRGTYTVQAHRRGGGSGSVEHVKVGDSVTIMIKDTGSIAGTVSSPDGAPPEQFTIRLSNPAAGFFRSEPFMFTDGAWKIRDVPEGKHEIAVESAEGTASTEVTLASGEQRTGVVLALLGRATVKGQVVSLESGAPMVGVRVHVYHRQSMAGPALANHETDSSGRFEVPQVPAGPVTVMTAPVDPMASEHDPASFPVDVEPGSVVDVGRIPMAKRRMKMGEMPGDLGFSLKMFMEPPPMAPPDLSARSLEVGGVREGGPAAAAGLRVGDVIATVDGHDVTGKMSYLYGTLTHVPEGTQVTLGVARGGSVAIVAAKMPVSPDMPPYGMPYPGAPPPPPPPPPPP